MFRNIRYRLPLPSYQKPCLRFGIRFNSTAGTPRPKNADEIVKRKLPKWAAKYADRFKTNPGSHLTSFLILHELTALLPLPLLFWLFHSFEWTPDGKFARTLSISGSDSFASP